MLKTNIIVILSIVIFSCSKNDDNDDTASSNCDQEIIIDALKYQNAPADFLTIQNVEINGDCMAIAFGASGCSGDSWGIKLIDSEVILESNPPKRNLRLSLKNEEKCQAFITREVTFNIASLQIEEGPVLVTLVNSNTEILYEN